MESDVYEYCALNVDHAADWCEVRAIPFRWKGQNCVVVLGAVAIVRFTTEYVRAENAKKAGLDKHVAAHIARLEEAISYSNFEPNN